MAGFLVMASGILIIITLLTLYVRYCKFGRQLAGIPGPKSLPLLGNALQTFGLDPVSAFTYVRKLSREYESINKLWSFLVGVVNVYHPDYVEKLLSTHQYTAKLKPYNFLRNWLGEGLLISNGEKWRQRRKLLTPAFHFSILRRFQDTFNGRTECLLARLQLEADQDHTDIVPIVCWATLDIMCETAMGITVNDDFESKANEYFNALQIFGKIMVHRLLTIWLHVDWIFNFSPLGRMEKTLLKDLHGVTRKIIEERKKKNNNSNYNVVWKEQNSRLAMLDLLLENEKEGKIDMEGIREEVDTFLFEGHDTTAMALCFMIMRIANETEIQDKIYEELKRIFGDFDRPPTMEDLAEMKYLECCIKESLRLYPSVPLLARYVINEVDLGKFIIPKGAITLIHVIDLHRNPELYPDPERFIPERFLPEPSAARHPYSYIPFSAGPRNCIGQRFAMAELKTVMSGILRKFQLEPITRPEDIEYVGDIVLRSGNPIYVKFRNRKNIQVK